jgi:hypothetical protein
MPYEMWEHLRDWMANSNRKAAQLEFTAGLLRDFGSAFESAESIRQRNHSHLLPYAHGLPARQPIHIKLPGI